MSFSSSGGSATDLRGGSGFSTTGIASGAGLALRLSLAATGAFGLSAALCWVLIGASLNWVSDGATPPAGAQGWHPGLLMLQMAIVGLGLALPALWLHRDISRRICRPLRALEQGLHRMAEGDLTHPGRIGGDAEVAHVMEQAEALRARLCDMVSTLRRAAASISSASSEIASGNADLSGRTEQAASSLEETASSMEELTGVVRQVAESAATAHGLAASSTELAVQGGGMVDQAVGTMQEIHAASRKIADIISVIDGIAFQTNILALNAAVEAARAGEQGRGFAVVAGEVRSLAQRSAEAARQIKSLILDSSHKVESGAELVTVAGRSMQDIVASVQRVADIIGEVKASSAEQSLGIIQVNSAVAELDQMTQQNAALVEQSAAASESLRDQAAELARIVQTFRVAGSESDAPLETEAAVATPRLPSPSRTAASASPSIDLWGDAEPQPEPSAPPVRSRSASAAMVNPSGSKAAHHPPAIGAGEGQWTAF